MTPLSSTARDSGRPVSQLVPGADDGTDSTNRYRRIDARHNNSHPLNTHRDQLLMRVMLQPSGFQRSSTNRPSLADSEG
jgi:hypothetical protein